MRPPAGFTRIDEQAALFVASDAWLVRVRVDGDVEFAFQPPQGSVHMSQDHLAAVGRFEAEGRFANRADDLHSGRDTRFISFVVAEAADEVAVQLAQRRHGKRRNQVTRKNHQFALRVVEGLNRTTDIVEMVVTVRKDSDNHSRDALPSTNEDELQRQVYPVCEPLVQNKAPIRINAADRTLGVRKWPAPESLEFGLVAQPLCTDWFPSFDRRLVGLLSDASPSVSSVLKLHSSQKKSFAAGGVHATQQPTPGMDE